MFGEEKMKRRLGKTSPIGLKSWYFRSFFSVFCFDFVSTSPLPDLGQDHTDQGIVAQIERFSDLTFRSSSVCPKVFGEKTERQTENV